MRKIFQISIFYFIVFCSTSYMFGQEQTQNDPDIQLKESLYKKYKTQVQGFDKKDFDELFFEYFAKQNESKVLTREEFYTYTIKIAIYSEKLGLLYKNQKEESQRAKQEWFKKSYTDYLTNKK